jgi:NADPH:quinone reductase-like Zn-dependent oxidoreductase
LGAEKVLDYRRQAFDATDQKYGVIFDTVGGETLARRWGLLAPGGRMVTVAAAGEQG